MDQTFAWVIRVVAVMAVGLAITFVIASVYFDDRNEIPVGGLLAIVAVGGVVVGLLQWIRGLVRRLWFEDERD